MKSFMLDKGRWLRAIKSVRKKLNTYNTYLTRNETYSETIQNHELLKKKKTSDCSYKFPLRVDYLSVGQNMRNFLNH